MERCYISGKTLEAINVELIGVKMGMKWRVSHDSNKKLIKLLIIKLIKLQIKLKTLLIKFIT